MTSTKQIIQAIIDYPKSSAAEIVDLLGDKPSVGASDIRPRLHTYIADGRILIEKREVAGAAPVNVYRASAELVAAFDGTEQLVTKAPRKERGRPPLDASAGFEVGFSSGGRIFLSKGAKKIDLTREESAELIAFLDSINIEKIVGAQA
ncbi:hypothetical protein [Burkholderia gladioli]|jgi:hypothetical protein|uniref:hypothetical protein n=1 Tax=Burkholderia gladioli TaxID=28095 RepID=UPI000F526FB0|nr:hypothetical protein [Burkholderia gladioli]